jgi:hypothetical protein
MSLQEQEEVLSQVEQVGWGKRKLLAQLKVPRSTYYRWRAQREQAFWILVAGMPELADILHERETRQPGWRSGGGKGQQVIERGMDIINSLYIELVRDHKFKTNKGKDP